MTGFLSGKTKDKDQQGRWQQFKEIIKKLEGDLSKYEVKAVSSVAGASAKFDSRHPAISIALKGLADIFMPSVSKALNAKMGSLGDTLQSALDFKEYLAGFEELGEEQYDKIVALIPDSLDEKIQKITDEHARQETLVNMLEMFKKSEYEARVGFSQIQIGVEQILDLLQGMDVRTSDILEIVRKILAISQSPYAAEPFTRPQKFEGEQDLFVGRVEKIDEVLDSLNNVFAQTEDIPRWITIWGMGGTGKSALAYYSIHQFEKMHDVQIIPIYFEKKLSLDDILETIKNHLNLDDREFEGKQKREVILSKMTHNIMLYADGFETISDPEPQYNDNAASIRAFLNQLPNKVIILATSRYNRNFSNEKLIEISDLEEKSAIELFAILARVDPKTESSNIRSVLEIIGYHPLAIEIVAQSYEGQGLSNMLQDIIEYGIIASKKEASENEKLHTVNSCIEFSFNRIKPRLQTLVTSLAQLHSLFSNQMAQNVFDAKRADLQHLYNRTMLRRTDNSSYGILDAENYLYDFHKLVRDYLLVKNMPSHDIGKYANIIANS